MKKRRRRSINVKQRSSCRAVSGPISGAGEGPSGVLRTIEQMMIGRDGADELDMPAVASQRMYVVWA
jgi:hypothetical protein